MSQITNTAKQKPGIDVELLEIYDSLWDDRVGFFKHILNITPTDQQGDALRAFDENDYVSISSGHGCGKSTVLAGCTIHYMSCRPYPKILCTAPSKHQIYQVLWAELSMLYRRMNPRFKKHFKWTKEKFFHKLYPEEWFAAARTATKEKPESLQGFHTDFVMRIIDEASGVDDSVFDVILGATGRLETKEIMGSNPTRLEGQFYRSHNQEAEHYKQFVWSCLNSPLPPDNYEPRIRKRYGEDSNVYRIRVEGLFPYRDSDSFIGYDLADSAVKRDWVKLEDQTGKTKVLGVDVARYGDNETVIAVREGDFYHPFHRLRNKNSYEVGAYVARVADGFHPDMINVDVIGYGSGVVDFLEARGYPVIPINVSETKSMLYPDKYHRLRDELWGNMRDWLQMRRGRLWDNDDGELVAQLSTPKYTILPNGKIKIETKDDMRHRNVESPDIADAHIMTHNMGMAEYAMQSDDFWPDYGLDNDEFTPLDPEAGY